MTLAILCKVSLSIPVAAYVNLEKETEDLFSAGASCCTAAWFRQLVILTRSLLVCVCRNVCQLCVYMYMHNLCMCVFALYKYVYLNDQDINCNT